MPELLGASGRLPGRFREASGRLPGSFRDASGRLPGFLRGASERLSGSFWRPSGGYLEAPGIFPLSRRVPGLKLFATSRKLPGGFRGGFLGGFREDSGRLTGGFHGGGFLEATGSVPEASRRLPGGFPEASGGFRKVSRNPSSAVTC